MKVKFFSCHTKNLNWKIVSEPFVKIEVNLIFGRNKRDKTFIPLIGLNDLLDGDYVSLTKNSKGTNLIVPATNSANDGFLIFLTVEGGFRGGISLHRNDGSTIIASANASAACESAISVCAIMPVNDPPAMLVFKETGRYGTVFHVYKTRVDDIVYNKLSKSDYEFLFEGGQDLS